MNDMKIKKRGRPRAMAVKVHIQRATKLSALPSNQKIRKWVRTALVEGTGRFELTVRMVGAREGALLNWKWRRKKGPTNVLSFPAADNARVLAPGVLGDLVICAPVIAREAMQQGKSPDAHWAHMIIHGTLHLMGYDHIKLSETRKMESLEIKLLAAMGIADPYK